MIRISALVALCCLFILSACKKGQDDPAFTLLSRKTRMEGSWHIVTGHLKIEDNKASKKETLEYDLSPAGLTVTLTSSGSSTVYVGQYDLTLNMKKNGDFSFLEKVGNTQLNGSGRWSFNSGAGETKKKADVMYVIENVESGTTSGLALFNKANTNFEYFIRELRSKKLVLETSSFIYINAEGDYQGIEGTLEFKQ